MENLSVGARELALFTENDGRLYESQWKPIQKNLATKKAQGKYLREGAVKLFGHLMDAAAKKYAIEHGDSVASWSKMFPKHDRLQAAKYFVELFEQGWKDGAFDTFVPKKYLREQGSPRPAYSYRPGSPLPGGLREAYAWTEAAGEIGELSRLKGRALNKYAKESAANSREHGELVYEDDIRELAKWLSETGR